jgi:hypothetical protein
MDYRKKLEHLCTQWRARMNSTAEAVELLSRCTHTVTKMS